MTIDQPAGRSNWTAMKRGALGRCPQCGQGKLFRAYLKPVAACAACGEPLGHIQADDGPAWLTIMVVGHIVVFSALAIAPFVSWPDWLSMTVWPGLTLILALILLPRAKGIFIGTIWATKAAGSEPV
jgi:uncharacterized protein (DUF983 family)